jgi:gamma-glutamyltranspeptidase
LIARTFIQVLLGVLFKGMDLLTAVVAPRIHSQLLPDVLFTEDTVLLGGEVLSLTAATRSALSLRGHVLQNMSVEGVCQAVLVDMDTDLRTAISDPRKDGRPAAQT